MKKYFYKVLSLLLAVFLLIGAAMVIVDPYFHYHKPLPGLSYRLYEERYINDGISRYFDFNGLITGTSMNQNFKTTEAEQEFGGTFVKETFSGAAFQELSDALERSIERNPKLDTVIWGLDYNGLRREADFTEYEGTPEYLYDNNPFNDLNYLYNKDILNRGLLNTLVRTLRGEPSTTFDEYSAWEGPTGFEHIMESYDRAGLQAVVDDGTWYYVAEDEAQKTYDNITQNLIPVIEAHPEVEFYLFYSPYCILYWDSLNIEGAMEMQLEAERTTTDLLLPYDNVHLFSFYENTELIENLDLYRNKEHYIAEVNSMILKWMANGEYQITQENKDSHMEFMYEYYPDYPYEALFER